ncbi:hypothetical protein [Archangium sp.]|uniref:hypothetical protein n=1 Tax=Archangium sp. TaxID=1872627 RepID=UPI002D772D27|nr:hypothetical protein [Archangium sp.]
MVKNSKRTGTGGEARIHRSLLVALLTALAMGCGGVTDPNDGDGGTKDGSEIDFDTCPANLSCPPRPSPEACSGDWWNSAGRGQPAPADCPGVSSSCATVILGRCNAQYDDICKYRNCPGHIALNMKDDKDAGEEAWSIGKNDLFIACAAAGLLDNQCPNIVIGSPSEHIPTPKPGETGSVTYRELCQLNACGCPPRFSEDGGTASGSECHVTDGGP